MLLKSIFIFILTFSFIICQEKLPVVDSSKLNDIKIDDRAKVLLYLDSMFVTRDKDILKSLELYDLALPIVLDNKMKALEAELYFTAAGQYNLISDPGKAIELYNKSISIYDSLNLFEKSGKAHNNLAWVYGTNGNKEKELLQYKKAYEMVTIAGSEYYTAHILSNIGDCYVELDSLDLAMVTQKKVLGIYQKLNKDFNSGITLRKMALINHKKTNYIEGIRLAKLSIELLTKTDKKLEYQRSLRALANNYIGIKEYEKALILSDEAINISKKLKSNDDERVELKKNYLLKMRILYGKGEFAEAENYLTFANNYQDTLNSNHKDEILEIFKERYHKEKLKSEVSRVELQYQQTYFILLSGFIILILFIVFNLFISNFKKKKLNKKLIGQKNELELLNEKFNSFFENSNRAIRVTNTNNEIILWNKAAEELTGIKKTDALGNKLNDVLDSNIKYVKNQDTTFKECINYLSISPQNLKENGTKISRNLHIAVRTNEGKIKHFYDSIFLIETSTDKYVGGVTDDVSDEKENEFRLIKALEKVEESNKLKSEFLAQMSHEIRTPVNTILSFISLVQEETKKLKNEDIDTSFNMIEQGSNRLIRTIDLILDMSQLQSGTFESHNRTVDLVKNILVPLDNEYQYKAVKKGLSFKFENNISDIVHINIDVYIITQTLINLLDNAIKYTDSGIVKIGLYENENKLICIDVSDTGIGMSKTFLDNLFLPFSQEEQGYTRQYEGNGLGLSLVKKYCELMNAEVKVTSEKGVGSVFTIVLNTLD